MVIGGPDFISPFRVLQMLQLVFELQRRKHSGDAVPFSETTPCSVVLGKTGSSFVVFYAHTTTRSGSSVVLLSIQLLRSVCYCSVGKHLVYNPVHRRNAVALNFAHEVDFFMKLLRVSFLPVWQLCCTTLEITWEEGISCDLHNSAEKDSFKVWMCLCNTENWSLFVTFSNFHWFVN